MSIECQLIGLLTDVSTGICSGSDLLLLFLLFFLTKNCTLTLLILKFKYILLSTLIYIFDIISVLIDQYRFLFPGLYNSKLRFPKRLKLNCTGCKFILVAL